MKKIFMLSAVLCTLHAADGAYCSRSQKDMRDNKTNYSSSEDKLKSLSEKTSSAKNSLRKEGKTVSDGKTVEQCMQSFFTNPTILLELYRTLQTYSTLRNPFRFLLDSIYICFFMKYAYDIREERNQSREMLKTLPAHKNAAMNGKRSSDENFLLRCFFTGMTCFALSSFMRISEEHLSFPFHALVMLPIIAKVFPKVAYADAYCVDNTIDWLWQSYKKIWSYPELQKVSCNVQEKDIGKQEQKRRKTRVRFQKEEDK